MVAATQAGHKWEPLEGAWCAGGHLLDKDGLWTLGNIARGRELAWFHCKGLSANDLAPLYEAIMTNL